MTSHKTKRTLKNILLWAVIIIVTAWVVFPFYWAIITSFKPPGVIMTKPSLIPFLQYQPTLYNWQSEFTQRWREIGRGMGRKNFWIRDVAAEMDPSEWRTRRQPTIRALRRGLGTELGRRAFRSSFSSLKRISS